MDSLAPSQHPKKDSRKTVGNPIKKRKPKKVVTKKPKLVQQAIEDCLGKLKFAEKPQIEIAPGRGAAIIPEKRTLRFGYKRTANVHAKNKFCAYERYWPH